MNSLTAIYKKLEFIIIKPNLLNRTNPTNNTTSVVILFSSQVNNIWYRPRFIDKINSNHICRLDCIDF